MNHLSRVSDNFTSSLALRSETNVFSMTVDYQFSQAVITLIISDKFILSVDCSFDEIR